MQKNAISWFEIPVTDMDRAQKFYETIFGMNMIPMEMPNFVMRMFPTEDMMGVGGALIYSRDFYKSSATDGTLIYLNANPDVDIVLSKVNDAGGQVILPKTQISPEHGYMGLLVDSEGNRIGLHSVPENYIQ